MIIRRAARQPEPRLPANLYQENQLSGDLPTYYPSSQVYAGGFAVSAIEEEPRASQPRPIPAKGWHGAHDSIAVELIEEPEGSWRKNLLVLPGSLDDFFHDSESSDRKPERPPKRPARGEDNGAAKLTAAAVVQMRARAACGVSQRRLAREFKVSRATVGDVLSGKTWAHIPDEKEQ